MNIKKIEKIAREYQASVTGKLGFGFKDLKTGQTVFLNGVDEFPTASTFKVFILAELFRRAAAGEFKMSDRFELTDEVKSVGSGVLFNLCAGANLTLQDYATLMMIISDNTATDFLFDFVTPAGIRQNVIEPFGLTRTKCDFPCKELIFYYYGGQKGETFAQLEKRLGDAETSFRNLPYYTCETAENDSTSPMDIMKIIELMYKKELFGEWASEEMLKIMKTCQTNSRIPKHLPPNVEVAHKTGTIDRFAADAGIVYSPKGDYLIALYYNGNLATEEEYAQNVKGELSDTLLANISRDVYKAYVE